MTAMCYQQLQVQCIVVSFMICLASIPAQRFPNLSVQNLPWKLVKILIVHRISGVGSRNLSTSTFSDQDVASQKKTYVVKNTEWIHPRLNTPYKAGVKNSENIPKAPESEHGRVDLKKFCKYYYSWFCIFMQNYLLQLVLQYDCYCIRRELWKLKACKRQLNEEGGQGNL